MLVKKTKKNTILQRVSRIKIKVDKNLDIYTGKVLFPEKLEKANKLLKGVKIP